MPTELGESFNVAWRGDPQQMLPKDIPLWHTYLEKAAHQFLRFYYNVRVGGPDVSKIKASPELAYQWYASTAKRIDAIGEKEKEIWIIEVASNPYIRAVGQCLSYPFLWNEDPKIDKPAKMILLCYFIDSDLERILKHHGVTIVTPEKPTL
jgi:hypothetical protein